MPLTKSFRDTVQARAAADPAFRAALLQEAVQTILDGEHAVGRAHLRDLVNATVGFPSIAADVGVGVKSLMRMLGPDGNPQMDNLVAIVGALRKHCGVALTVHVKAAARRGSTTRRRDLVAA